MRVIAGPWQFILCKIINPVHLAHLQPAPNPVKRSGVPDELPGCALLLHIPEQAEKQEQIAHPYLLFAKVSLGGAGLTQARPPAGFPGINIGYQVRVEVCFAGAATPVSR